MSKAGEGGSVRAACKQDPAQDGKEGLGVIFCLGKDKRERVGHT